MWANEKSKQIFLQHPPVPVRHVAKSFEVVIIPVLMLKTYAPQISYKPVVQACNDFIILMRTSKGEQSLYLFSLV